MHKWLSIWGIGQDVTVEDFTKIKEAGFVGVEVWAEHKHAIQHFEYAQQNGLEIGLHLPFHDLNLASPFQAVEDLIFKENLKWFKLLQKYNGGHAVIHGGSAMASEYREEAEALLIKRLSVQRAIAREHGVELLFENQIPDGLNYMHIFPSSVEEWLSILHETNTKACLDTGHLTVLDADLRETIEKLGDKLVSVHLSDNDAKSDLHLMPGEGNNTSEGLEDILQANGYTGPVVFEINPYKYTLEEILQHPSVKA